MGWTFACDPSFGRKELIARMRAPGYLSNGYKMLESTAVGNHFWFRFETPAGKRQIGITLMKGGGRGSGWGEKGMEETWGPCCYDCPLHYLDNVDEPPNDNAAAWRLKVREYHANKKARKAVHVPGTVVVYGDVEYKLLRSLGRSGWDVERVSDGQWMRMKSRQLAQARPALLAAA